jgi:hypothetical protein
MSHVTCGLPCWSVIPSRDESRLIAISREVTCDLLLPCWSAIPSRDESRTNFYITGCHMWLADSLVGVLYPAEMKVDQLLYPGMSHVTCGLPCWSVIPSRDESRTDFYIPGCHMWLADSLVGVLYPAEMKVGPISISPDPSWWKSKSRYLRLLLLCLSWVKYLTVNCCSSALPCKCIGLIQSIYRHHFITCSTF